MGKAARLLIVTMLLLSIVALSSCVSSSPATKVAGTWTAVNPRSPNFTYTLASAKGVLDITAKNALDGSTIGAIKISIKTVDDKAGTLSGPIQNSSGIYKDLAGTAYINFSFDESSQKGLSVLYVAISATSYPDFSPQLAFVKR